jgi:hypothetical protein
MEEKNEFEDIPESPAVEQARRNVKPLPARVMKLQRNGPCPCGSGKKYKKCHMKKYQKTNFDIRTEVDIDKLEEMIG